MRSRFTLAGWLSIFTPDPHRNSYPFSSISRQLFLMMMTDDDDVEYNNGENKDRKGDGKMGVGTREWKGMTAGVLVATP